MILFYNKTTGHIIGTIAGRVHSKLQLNMYIGKKEENKRLVVEWKKEQDEEGNDIYVPDTHQRELFAKFDAKQEKPTDYKIDLTTGDVVKK